MTRYRIIYSDGTPGSPLSWYSTLQLVQGAMRLYRIGSLNYRPVRVERIR